MDTITGTFSVKFAYYVARKVLGRKEVTRNQRDKVWRVIWSASTAPKIKKLHVETDTKDHTYEGRTLREKDPDRQSMCLVFRGNL